MSTTPLVGRDNAPKKHIALTRNYNRYLREQLNRCPDWTDSRLSNGLTDDDFFITLTFKPHVRITEIQRSKAVGHFLRKLNTAVYGGEYRRGRKCLRYCGCFEISKGGSLHLHALLSAPEQMDRLRGESYENLVKRLWVGLDLAGKIFAQDAVKMYEVLGALRYSTKGINSPKHYANLDVMNWNITGVPSK